MSREDRFCAAFLLVIVVAMAIEIMPAFFDGRVFAVVSHTLSQSR